MSQHRRSQQRRRFAAPPQIGGPHELGQNWLVDRRFPAEMAEILRHAPPYPVLELDAGNGALAALVPLVAAFALCLVTLGVMITSLCHTIQQVSAVAFGGLVLFGALGGALVPLEVLPGWAHGVAPVTPTYWVMRGFGSVILNGHSLPAIVLPCLVLIGMSLAFVAVSLRRFRFADAKVSF